MTKNPDCPKEPTLRTTMLPRDTNAGGIIFGGVILSQIDLAGGIEARKHTQKSIVTVAIKEVKFISPVYVGDLVSYYTEIVATGTTSITIRIQVRAERAADGFKTSEEVTEAVVIYVAIDKNRRPIAICE